MTKEPLRSARWDNTIVSGSATLHQGDNYITNHLHVLPEHLALLQTKLGLQPVRDRSARRKTRNRPPTGHHDDETQRRWEQGVQSQKDLIPWSSIPLYNAIALTSSRQETSCLPLTPTNAPLPGIDTILLGTPAERTALYNLLQKLQQCVASWATSISMKKLQAFTKLAATNHESQHLASTHTEIRLLRAQELQSETDHLLWICLVLITLFLGRDLSPKDVTNVAARIHQDRLFPFMCVLLTFVLTRWFYLCTIAGSLSIGDQLVLEDAYGMIKSIPLAVCQDWLLLKECLKTHYRETDGVAALSLVQADMFSLTLNSRQQGVAIRSEDWSRMVIKPGARIVNSVYVDTKQATCLTCLRKMRVDKTRKFVCAICKVLYKDIDIPQSLPTYGPMVPKQNFSYSKSATSMIASRHKVPHYPQKSHSGLGTFSLIGLKHIDLRLLPSARKTPTKQFLPKETLIDTELVDAGQMHYFPYPKGASSPDVSSENEFDFENELIDDIISSFGSTSKPKSPHLKKSPPVEKQQRPHLKQSQPMEKPKVRRSRSQKEMLSRACSSASKANKFANERRIDEAISQYLETCDILCKMRARTTNPEDRVRLSTTEGRFAAKIAYLKDISVLNDKRSQVHLDMTSLGNLSPVANDNSAPELETNTEKGNDSLSAEDNQGSCMSCGVEKVEADTRSDIPAKLQMSPEISTNSMRKKITTAMQKKFSMKAWTIHR